MKTTRFQFGPFEALAIPVLVGTFAHCVCRGGQAILVDAGEAGPVFRVLEREKLQLLEMLITHTHYDHVGGCRAIQDRLGVLARSPGGEECELSMLGTRCRIVSTPGHTAVHKSYYFPEPGIVFTGDALINGACGRLLGGTAEQHFSSLRRICELPDETRVFGGHDYLVENMRFALKVEPDNTDVQERLDLYRTDPAAALFATLAEEKRTNPFLRVDTVEAFAELRSRKDWI